MGKRSKSGKEAARNTFVEVPCIIAFDQSYTRTGVSVAVNGKVKKVYSIDYKGLLGKTEKRWKIRDFTRKVITMCLSKYGSNEIVVIVERLRTFTQSDSLRMEVIKSGAALIATIVDTAMEYNVRTFSVDTRAWKSRVLGDSRPIFEPIEGVSNPQKFGSVRKAIKLGFGEKMKVVSAKKKNAYTYNDDMADAICMSLYPFTGYPYLLLLEK